MAIFHLAWAVIEESLDCSLANILVYSIPFSSFSGLGCDSPPYFCFVYPPDSVGLDGIPATRPQATCWVLSLALPKLLGGGVGLLSALYFCYRRCFLVASLVGLYTLIEASSWERVRFGWFWIGLVLGHIVWNVTSGRSDMVKHARLVSLLGLFGFSVSLLLHLLYILQSFSLPLQHSPVSSVISRPVLLFFSPHSNLLSLIFSLSALIW